MVKTSEPKSMSADLPFVIAGVGTEAVAQSLSVPSGCSTLTYCALLVRSVASNVNLPASASRPVTALVTPSACASVFCARYEFVSSTRSPPSG